MNYIMTKYEYYIKLGKIYDLKRMYVRVILLISQLLFTRKRGNTMEQFVRKFMQLNGRTATIILEHCWFDKQRFEAQEVNVFEDKDRLGLIIKGQAVFIYKNRLCSMELRDNVVEFADEKLKILIKF